MWSEARVKVDHRLAMHLRVDDGFRLRKDRPMITFTFDDLPKSAATIGADILESYGSRGTFYVSGGLVGIDTPDWATGSADDVVSLHRRGHEVGCHTFSHRRACDLDETSLAEEIDRNRTYFHSLDPTMSIETFAYPFGYGSYARKHQLKSEFRTCRSIVPGVNSGEVDPQFLRAVPLIDRQMTRGRIDQAFEEARNTNGWLIFYSHDVAERPSLYGCSPDLMTYAMEAATRRGIPALTMAEAFRCARG